MVSPEGPGGPGGKSAPAGGAQSGPLTEELFSRTPWTARRQLAARLTAAGCPDPDFDAQELLRLVLKADPLLAAVLLTETELQRLAELCEKRCSRYPLQYLLGRWPFLDFDLAVGPGVLIPRADTETVCEAAAACIRGLAAPKALDLCAGSGALALGLKRLVPQAEVTALEKSPDALRYLRQNARTALRGPAQFHAMQGGKAADLAAEWAAPAIAVAEGDVFAYQDALAPASLDLIVSNPPYLTGPEMAALQPEVAFEPPMALDGGPDGLMFYRHIARAYRPAVRPGGALVLEVGWQQADAVSALLLQNGWQAVETRQDLGGNTRAVLARAPE